MRFSYNWLKELVHFKESPKKISELLTLHSFEAAVAGKVGNDWAIEARIPTNRISDAASHWGLGRELAAIGPYRLRIEPPRIGMAPATAGVLVKIHIAPLAICPRYTAQVLKVKNVRPSPKWMTERLATCGFRPLNNIVDATNYVMLETGQPLHAFDLDAIRGKTMTIRESREGETLTTLDGVKRALPRGTLVIEDRQRLIDLAGIMGGANSAVSERTERILLQAAAFDPAKIYRAMRALGFSSEAGKIYAAGIDPNRTAVGLERAIQLLAETADAEAVGKRTDIYRRRVYPQKLLLRRDYVRGAIGEEITPRFYSTLWKRLGFEAQERRDGWLVEVPTSRRDIQIEEDIIEEIARLWGYQRLRALPPETHLMPMPLNEALFWQHRIEDALAGAGLTEIHTYRFIGQQLLEAFGSATDDLLELENPMNPDTRYLNAHPAHHYIQSAIENLRHSDRVSIFGITSGFKRTAKPTLEMPTDERRYLVIAHTVKGAPDEGSFYAVKGTLDHLFESLGIADHWYDDALTPAERKKTVALHPYRTAKVMVGDEFLGVVAELHPAVQQRLKSKARLVFSQIDFEKLWKLARAEAEFKPIGKYPAVIRDIAVIVPEDTKADDVEDVIQNASGTLLVDSDLFDYFQDEAMTERGEKSLAFHLIFQSPERTLTDAEVNRLYQRIAKALKEREWEIRE